MSASLHAESSNHLSRYYPLDSHSFVNLTETNLLLVQVFDSLPAHIGIDVEIKMTTPDTQLTHAAEVDRVVVPILETVFAATTLRPRTVVFTSFDPEVCIALSERQCLFPVMFLSGGGAYQHVDERRTSIVSAVNFAACYGLRGIVLKTEALKNEEHMVAEALSKKLLVMTYGQGNEDVSWVVRQNVLGVHAAIVDNPDKVVSGISKVLLIE